MSFIRFFAVFTLLLSLMTAPAQAQPEAKYSKVDFVSPVTATGDLASVPAALVVTMTPGWKTYWRTPGDSGLAPVIDSAGSSNVSAASLRWPAPHRFTIYDIDNFGYKDNVTFPVDITPATIGGAIEAKLRVDLLVCSDICVPESHSVSLSLPAGTASDSAHKAVYDAALATLPKADIDGVKLQSAELTVTPENRAQLSVSALITRPLADDADLFVESNGDVSFLKPDIAQDTATGETRFSMLANTTIAPDKLAQDLAGKTLTLTFVDKDGSLETTLPLTVSGIDVAPVDDAEVATLEIEPDMPKLGLSILLVAFIGGLILNLMPCVLPVLSLKVLSVLKHGGKGHEKEHRQHIFASFMASAAGIISSFWLMASALVALKTAGMSIGWGIQFQHPTFLIFLLVVVLAFALNMWGAFEIPLPRFIAHRIGGRKSHDSEGTLLGNFLTGAFATLLATPCTAPFLGTAVGFALAGSTLDIFAVFTFLGLGLATPYITLALIPRLFKYLPKPGKWMVTLRKILAVALFATAAWLVSILFTVATQPTLDSGWQKFDQSQIAPAVADGKVVIVDVTADWCLTCKANKRLVLEQADIMEALNQPHIIKLQADWTQRDEVIATYLRSFGKFGIPFNIVYGPAAPEGIVLPELLSKRLVLDALTMAAGESL